MHIPSRALLLLVIFMIGFAALIYQIYSVQLLFMFFIHNSHAVALTISSFLAGLAVSSLIFSRITRDKSFYLPIVFWMQLAAALYGFFLLRNIELVPLLLDTIAQLAIEDQGKEFLKISLIWIFLLIPALFVGGALPLINGLYVETLSDTGRDTGTVYFWDTLGAIFGALLAGFWLLPVWGIEKTIIVPVLINLFICTLVANRIYLRLTIAALYFAVLAFTYHSHSQEAVVSNTQETPAPTPAESASNKEEKTTEYFPLRKPALFFVNIQFQKESPFGKVTVDQVNDVDKKLFINFRDMCSTYGIKDGSETELSRILASTAPKGNALNIGMGCGFTAQELYDSEHFDAVHIVEINPIVVEASSTHFRKENPDVFSAENVEITIEDGANYIRNTEEKYASIAIDVEEVNVIYSSPLYTKEYFEIAKSKMHENGVIGVWSFHVNDDFARVLLNTMASVFKYTAYHPQETGDLFFGSDAPLNLPEIKDEKLLAHRTSVEELENDDVNQLNKMTLQQYYNMHTIFNLPQDYNEEFTQ